MGPCIIGFWQNSSLHSNCHYQDLKKKNYNSTSLVISHWVERVQWVLMCTYEFIKTYVNEYHEKNVH